MTVLCQEDNKGRDLVAAHLASSEYFKIREGSTQQVLFVHDDSSRIDVDVEEEKSARRSTTKAGSAIDTSELRHLVTMEVDENEEYSADFQQESAGEGLLDEEDELVVEQISQNQNRSEEEKNSEEAKVPVLI